MSAARKQPLGHGSPTRLAIVLGAVARRDAAERRGKSIKRATAAYLADLKVEGIRISLSTLNGWLRAYRVNGPLGLVDHRVAKARPDLEFLQEVRRLFELSAMLSMESVYLLACEEAQRRGWRACDFNQARRYIRRHVLPAIRKGAGPLIDPSSQGN